MSWKRGVILLFVGGLAVGVDSVAGQAPAARSPSETAADLNSGDRDRIARALATIPLRYDPESDLGWYFPDWYTVTAEVSRGLIAALYEEGQLFDGGDATEAVSPPFELVLDLMHFVIALRDPASIPALLQTLGTGTAVRDALLYFGPSVIADLAAVATDPGSQAGDVGGALRGLGEAVARWGPELDQGTRGTIREAAITHLPGTPAHFASADDASSALSGAITLASELRDPDLMEMLRTLAEDEVEIAIPDHLRRRAAAALERPLVDDSRRRRPGG